MIINKDFYRCKNCNKTRSFDTSKPYSKICPECHEELQFWFNGDCDTERAEWVKKQPKYDPISDPKSPFFIKYSQCPCCGAINKSKVIPAPESFERYGILGLFGIKRTPKWRCSICGCEFD